MIAKRVLVVSAVWLGVCGIEGTTGVISRRVPALFSQSPNFAFANLSFGIYYWFFLGYLGSLLVTAPSKSMTSLLVSGERYYRYILIGVYLLYVAIVVSKFVQPNFWSLPIVQDDHALHFVDALAGRAHLLDSGLLWGYDPFHAAGRLTFGIDNFWQTAFLVIFGFLGAISSNIRPPTATTITRPRGGMAKRNDAQ